MSDTPATSEQVTAQDERPVCVLPIRPVTPLYSVVVNRDLDIRGRTYLGERKIVLRTWDEEVLLHECLHALLHEGRMTKVPGYGDDRSTIVQANEEELVSHLSHGLYQLGFRWVEYEQTSNKEEQARDDERQLHHDFGREIAWELETGRLDSPYLQGVLARVRANDGFTQDEEWPDV